ncbi:MAG: CD225/dispanin family protein [Muribaculum sp.]|nr:CD225/dispanin family protein [Muribaculum sp.]
MRYWAIINNVKVGPAEPEQLLSYGLTSETLVWCQGWTQWFKAGFVDEFRPWLGLYNDMPSNRPPMPQSYLAWSLIATLLCCLPLGIVAVIYSTLVESRYAAGNYAGSLRASETAKGWCIASAIAGFLYYCGGILLYAFPILNVWR